MTLLGPALALLVGFVLGLLGGGGSILAVPVLVYVVGLAPKPAIATGLIVVAVAAFIAFLSHWRQGSVRLRVVSPFAASAVLAAFIGARAARYVQDDWQLLLFGIFGLIAAVPMLRGGSGKGSAVDRQSASHPGAADMFRASPRRQVRLAVHGSVVGFLTGLIGVGGGFLIVPALTGVAGLPMRVAVGTSLLVLTLNALSGFAGYATSVLVDWVTVAWFTALAALGSLAGAFVSGRVPQRRLQQVFGILLIAVSVYVILRR